MPQPVDDQRRHCSSNKKPGIGLLPWYVLFFGPARECISTIGLNVSDVISGRASIAQVEDRWKLLNIYGNNLLGLLFRRTYPHDQVRNGGKNERQGQKAKNDNK